MPTITPRRPALALDADGEIPRHWFGSNAVATQLANGINLLFPHGERFFVRSVRRYLDRIDDASERDDVRGFFAQEGRHAAEHERFFRIMEAQGYEIQSFLAFYERWSKRIESLFAPRVRLATTAACEHFTATLAHAALAEGLLDTAHPRMQALLFWHAAEEIEHKAVAYDVLQKVAPSYAIRVTGLVVAAATLGGFWIVATRHLLAQDGVGVGDTLRELIRLRRHTPVARSGFKRGIRAYLGRDFHPWQHDDRELAERHLRSMPLAPATV